MRASWAVPVILVGALHSTVSWAIPFQATATVSHGLAIAVAGGSTSIAWIMRHRILATIYAIVTVLLVVAGPDPIAMGREREGWILLVMAATATLTSMLRRSRQGHSLNPTAVS